MRWHSLTRTLLYVAGLTASRFAHVTRLAGALWCWIVTLPGARLSAAVTGDGTGSPLRPFPQHAVAVWEEYGKMMNSIDFHKMKIKLQVVEPIG